ncbi:hypothetical protein PAXRUDRAFT_660116 [Paxillus rubicundulus Ve08.2h10]|uniref:Uncharacterized protein n=1 Tax=Paxillus rubicundulus Ve08.2h10 TaxID=930991 RepID=A0A0D0DIL8_9AGAM|nr:hypothetical protein PAXRUDRAFT_660116 [Paxillus rubicundulus Ve08.2h10]
MMAIRTQNRPKLPMALLSIRPDSTPLFRSFFLAKSLSSSFSSQQERARCPTSSASERWSLPPELRPFA